MNPATLTTQIACRLLQEPSADQGQDTLIGLIIRWAAFADLGAAQPHLQARSTWEEIRSRPEPRIRQELVFWAIDEIVHVACSSNDPDTRVARDRSVGIPDDIALAQQLASFPPSGAVDILTHAAILWGWSLDVDSLREFARIVAANDYSEDWDHEKLTRVVFSSTIWAEENLGAGPFTDKFLHSYRTELGRRPGLS